MSRIGYVYKKTRSRLECVMARTEDEGNDLQQNWTGDTLDE